LRGVLQGKIKTIEQISEFIRSYVIEKASKALKNFPAKLNVREKFDWKVTRWIA
jgi:hypothetical protein